MLENRRYRFEKPIKRFIQVAGIDAVCRDEGLLDVDDVVDAAIRVEVGLDVVEDDH
jgi:hypothetical protein